MAKCDMEHDCAAPVTHLDDKGYVYCTEHAADRRGYRRVRKLRQYEINRINCG